MGFRARLEDGELVKGWDALLDKVDPARIGATVLSTNRRAGPVHALFATGSPTERCRAGSGTDVGRPDRRTAG